MWKEYPLEKYWMCSASLVGGFLKLDCTVIFNATGEYQMIENSMSFWKFEQFFLCIFKEEWNSKVLINYNGTVCSYSDDFVN